jgi:peptide subunit release factor 1 (eRF1)
MFGGHRQRIERLEAVVAVMASNQRQFVESLKALVEGANENARNSNANFDAILDALRVVRDSIKRLREDEDDADNWWRKPHD